MEPFTTIKNINDSRLAPYRSLKVRRPEQDGIFIVESRPAVRLLLNTDLEIVSCLTTEKVYKEFREETPLLEKKRIPVYLMEKAKIENIIGFRFHQGIMMAVKSPKRASMKDKIPRWHSPHILIALNGVHDPQNMGLIIRNAAAFGADTLIVDAQSFEPYYRKVVRISMGAIFNIPVAYETNLIPALQRLKKDFGTKIIVTTPGSAHINLNEADLSGNICLVLGNEFSGVSAEILNIADLTVQIPIFFNRADSLNVACASAIFLYQASLQRK